jgi:hypothetical protein
MALRAWAILGRLLPARADYHLPPRGNRVRRDMDLVRKIALALADHEHGFAPDDFAVEGYSAEAVDYHVYLMADGGLLDAEQVKGFGDPSPRVLPKSLTWVGQDFADAARNEGVWNKAKTLIAKAGSSAFPVWVKVLTELGIRQVME